MRIYEGMEHSRVIDLQPLLTILHVFVIFFLTLFYSVIFSHLLPPFRFIKILSQLLFVKLCLIDL